MRYLLSVLLLSGQAWGLGGAITETSGPSTGLGAAVSCTGSSLNIDSGSLYVDCTNNLVGYGTTAPTQQIHASSGTVLLDGDDPQLKINGVGSATDPFVVGTSTFIIKGNTGRVGIGAAAPSTLLHISSGTVMINGTGGLLDVVNANATTPTAGTSNAALRIRSTESSPAVPVLEFATAGGTPRATIRADAGDNLVLNTGQTTGSIYYGADVNPTGHLFYTTGLGNNATINSIGLRVALPAAQTIAAGNTVTADACGGIKLITAGGAVTTDTTNTFTAPAAANAGCVMNVCNSGANNITLDNNANFKSAGGADVVVTADDCVQVGSTGSVWYQLSALLAN